ncbi:hypothetical protein GCM10029963_28570 [Micromonospora andamanensis]|uniref:WhiB family transcriptional regulator n=1 Tax=Micromonospora andamanensis TaxID=1287068 RepID=UPI0019526D6D|nr:WhiB family transcriptional regulator [Micromonospora andamanensis]GIJ38509.1 hypothetical protein Vwe01_18340 [Micromonospora andamanensis]
MTCHSDPELFFDPMREDEAVKVCAGCPLADGCRIRGLREDYGVWGGSTPLDRAVARFKAATPATQARALAFAVVVELAAERGHHTPDEVAAATKLPRWSVRKRMEGHGKERDAEVAWLRVEGASITEIGLRLGMDRNEVNRALVRSTQAVALAA